MFILAGVIGLGVFEEAVADLRGPIGSGRPAQPRRPAVELGRLDVPALLIGLTAAKSRSFKLPMRRAQTCRHHAINDVSGIEPMMGDRRLGIIARAIPVHERRRPQRRLPDRAAIKHQFRIGGDIEIEPRR